MHPLFSFARFVVLLAATAAVARAEQVTLTVVDDTCLVQDGGGDDNNFGGRNELLTSNSSTTGSNRRFGLLRFDVSSLSGQFASIDSMTLKLRLRNGGGRVVPATGQIMDIFRIAEANAGWVEGTGLSTAANDGVTRPDTATYRAKSDNADVALRLPWAGSAGLNGAGIDYFAVAMGSTLAFNGANGYAPGTVIDIPLIGDGFTLTEMVNAWITGGSTNAGLLIRGQSGTATGQIFFDSIETTDPGAQAAQLVINYTPGTTDPYVIWAAANALTGADVDPTSDPDNDGAINLLEFALDGNPKSGGNGGKMVHAVTGIAGENALVLTLPVRNGASFSGPNWLTGTADGVRYEIRASADLTLWDLDVDEVMPALSAGLPELSAGYRYHSFRLAGPLSAGSRAFLQVAVSQAP